MKIGMQLHPERGVKSTLEEARQADDQGFDSVWLGDHLISGKGSWKGPDGPDGPLDHLTLMTAVGAVTSHVRLAFSMLNISFRYPAMLAKVIATLDQITEGRVICSLGSGSYPEEFSAYGIPYIEDKDERVWYQRELILLLKELWTHPAPALTTFDGKYIQVTDLPFNPKPYQNPHPPIWLGGESEQTLQLVKDLADGWVTLTRAENTLGRGDAGGRIATTIKSPGWPTDRPMTVVLQSRIFVSETHDAAVADATQAVGTGVLEGFLNSEIVGTPDECLERIQTISDAGPNYLRVTFDDLAQQERAGRLLLPRLGEIK